MHVAAWMGGEIGGNRYTCMHGWVLLLWLSPFALHLKLPLLKLSLTWNITLRLSYNPVQNKKLLKSDKARMEFFLLWGSGVVYLEGIILSSKMWKCFQNSIPLHFPSPKGEINSVFLFLCLHFNGLSLWTSLGKVFSAAEGLGQAAARLFCSKHPWMTRAIGQEQHFWSSQKVTLLFASKMPRGCQFPQTRL